MLRQPFDYRQLEIAVAVRAGIATDPCKAGCPFYQYSKVTRLPKYLGGHRAELKVERIREIQVCVGAEGGKRLDHSVGPSASPNSVFDFFTAALFKEMPRDPQNEGLSLTFEGLTNVVSGSSTGSNHMIKSP